VRGKKREGVSSAGGKRKVKKCMQDRGEGFSARCRQKGQGCESKTCASPEGGRIKKRGERV